jgi:uncharacterized protein YfaS (alpha-2-macroglobulin family)
MEQPPSIHVRFVSWLCAFFYQLFGSISWNSPPWLKHLKVYPRKGIGLVIGIILVLTASVAGYDWYQHRPKPSLVNARINPISLGHDHLSIDFVKNERMNLVTTAAAPLEQVGKPVNAGIEISPAISGRWIWKSDKDLVFIPEQSWSAGQTYRITFNKTALDSAVQMQSDYYDFSTPPLKVTVEELNLYQDLQDPKLRKIVGTLDFNFHVDRDSLSDHTRLVMQVIKDDRLDLTAQHYPLSITYDEYRRKAYIESEAIELPPVPSFVNLVIDKGVQALKGTSKTEAALSQKLLIPSFETFLQVKDLSVGIEYDNENNPEQILHLETTAGISNDDDILKYLQVYVLPEDYLATMLLPLRRNYQWSQPGEVNADVLKAATPVQLQALPEKYPFPTKHRFKFQAKVPGHLYVKIAKGLPGFGGFLLAKDHEAVVKVPDCGKEINFLHRGSLMALSGEKKMTVSVRGVPEVRFSIGQVLAPHVNHLMAQTYGDFQNPKFRYGSSGREGISQIFSEFRVFNVTNPCDLQYTTIDLEQYLSDNPSSLGLFLVKAQGWDTKNNAPTGVESSRLILITDMNLLVKDNADDTHDLFVQSITQGIPVAGAEVAVLGKNSLPLISAKTDEQGHVNFPSMEDFKEDREPTVYLVRNGDDISFIPYHRSDRRLNYSRFDIGGAVSNSENKLTAYLFTNRGIYRPGDSIHIGAIVKNSFAADLAPGLPLEAVITDPQGATVFNQKISLPQGHFFSLDYSIPSTASIGKYTVKLYVVKDNKLEHLLGYSSLRVEEFLPDRLKMQAHLVPAAQTDAALAWLSPDDLKAKISLWNLFGSTAVDHRVKGKIVIAPRMKAVYFPQFEGYRFADLLSDSTQLRHVFKEDLTEGHTNEEGIAEFHLNLERFSRATYQLDFIAEGFESDDGRAVSAETSALVSHMKTLVGYKAQGDLNYLKQQQQQRVHYIAVNPQLQRIAVNNLQIELMAIGTASTLVKKPDGRYEYQSVKQKTTVSQHPFDIGADGSEFILPTDKRGDFVLVLKDAQGAWLSKLHFSVVGENDHSAPKNVQLAVKLDKKVYQRGDTIEMQITAPYSGAGLISIERDRVYASQWFKADSPTSVQTITLPSDFQGNGYVNVAFVRAWDSDEIFINPLSYAVIPFTISNKKQTLQVNLDVPDFVRAGQELPIQFSTDKPAKIVLYAVDEGVLRIDSYQTPDPLAHFFRKHALTVHTLQIADLILPRYNGRRELSAIGGDKRASSLAMSHNPFKRKTDKAVAFWSGIVDAEPSPKTISYQVPDYFNGSLRIMAVAVASEKMGRAEKNTLVQNYFVLHPNVPTFVAPGDTVRVTAAISNSLKDDDDGTPVTVNLTVSSQFDIIGAAEESLVIPPGEERIVAFQIKANQTLGDAQLTFTAAQGERTSKMTSTVSVRPSSAYQTYLISGFDDSPSTTINNTLQLYSEHRIVEAAASTNPLILANGLKGYLECSLYDCTEQLVSKSLAQLAMAKQPFFHLDPAKVQEKFKQTIQILRERQTSSGGFSYWSGRGDTSSGEMASICALDYLIEAKSEGYLVPDDLFSKGIRHLENFSRQTVRTLSEARMQAYAIYLLTRTGFVTTNYLTNLQLYLIENHQNKWHKDLTGAYIAATYKLLQGTKEADRLIGKYPLHQTASAENNDFYNPLIGDAQYMTLLARHFPEHLNKIKGDAIVALVQGMGSDQLNTLSAAYSVRALAAYAHANTEGGNVGLQKVDFDPEGKQFRFHNPEKQRIFYQVTQAGFDKNTFQKSVKDGLEVFREYRDGKDNPIDSAEQGDKIVAHIKARTRNDQTINHIAIVDLLPGGFEVVPNSISQRGCDYVDVREDRIIFYCSLTPSVTEFSYRLQAVNKGDYAVPPIFAQSIYQQMKAQGVAGRIVVQDRHMHNKNPSKS